MEAIETVYLICFFLGLGFAVLSGLLSGVFSGGAEAHVDIGGSHEGIGHDASGIHFPILSPVTIAMFIASFGGAGIILKKINAAWYFHIPLSAAAAFVVAGLVAYFFYKVFTVTQASSEARLDEIVGLEGEVTVPIVLNGLGEVSYISKGARYGSPARSEDGKEIAPHTAVKITAVMGNIAVVKKIS